MPPALGPLLVSAAGALALGLGAVSALNGRAVAGLALALGGLLLLAWSVVKRRG